MDASDPQWIYIPGFPNYRVNARGEILTIKRQGTNERILKPRPDQKGYPSVTLYQGDGTKRLMRVHQIVALVFLGPRPDGLMARHLDGNQLNYAPENLRYGTHAENEQDKIRHGRNPELNKTHCRNGHPLSGSNLMLRRDGKDAYRRCKTCHNANIARYRARRRQRQK